MDTYIEDITCPRVDTNFIFECSTLTSERSERVRYRVEHSKIKFVSTSGHVIFCLLYKQNQGYFSNFPKISEHFPRISADFSKFSNSVRSSYEHFRSFSENFRRCPKISEDCRRLPNVSELSSKMFRSHRNEFRFVRQLNLVNVIAHTTSLLSPHVKISNLSSHVKISCFHSKRYPCNSLKFI